MIWIDKFISSLWNKAEKSCSISVESSSYVRIFVGFFILLTKETSLVYWLNDFPDALYNPSILSIGLFFSEVPNNTLLSIVDFTYSLAAIGITLGYRTRLSSWLFIFSYFFLYSFRMSFGKVDHIILMPLVVMCFSFSNWGTVNALRVDKKSKYHSKSSASLALLICIGMFTAGLEKAFRWIDFDLESSGFMLWFHGGFMVIGEEPLLADYIFKTPLWVFETFDYIAPIFELTPLLFLLSGKFWWRIWLAVACFFHLSNTLLLSIYFIPNIMVYSVFLYCFVNKKNVWFARNLSKIFYFLALTLGTLHIIDITCMRLLTVSQLLPSNLIYSLSNPITPALMWLIPLTIFSIVIFKHTSLKSSH